MVGIEAVIEVGMYVMRLLWEQNSQVEHWGFLLIDAWNTFNEENWSAMLWVVRHEWPSGAQFNLNCSYHCYTLVVCDLEGSGHSLHSK